MESVVRWGKGPRSLFASGTENDDETLASGSNQSDRKPHRDSWPPHRSRLSALAVRVPWSVTLHCSK